MSLPSFALPSARPNAGASGLKAYFPFRADGFLIYATRATRPASLSATGFREIASIFRKTWKMRPPGGHAAIGELRHEHDR